MPTVDTPLLERSSSHLGRSFAGLPDIGAAVGLLGEIAGAPCLFSPVPIDRPLALYGAGSLGRLARDFLKAVGRDFIIVVDRHAQQLADDPAWMGIRLLHPGDVPATVKSEGRVAVSIVRVPYVPLEQSLSQRGFIDVVPFYDLAESFRHLHPLSNGWFAPPLTDNDRANTAKVLALWGDDVSRAHHLQFLAWRRLREEWTFDTAPISNYDRFFIPEITGVLHDKEVFLDAGAHYGNVSENFIKQTKGAFRQIVTIEPDSSNRAVLDRNLRSWVPDSQRVIICDFAIAENEGEALFHAGLGYASQISDTGRMSITTRPVDVLGFRPTFVKLHLEGAELGALKGAWQTLLANRPIVAATVYHNADGIWATPLWLMETLMDYRFLFRLDSWCGTGAIVYAIPKERSAR